MRKLILIAAIAAAATALSCRNNQQQTTATGDKKTEIVFTTNFNKGTSSGQFNTDCIGIVATETIGVNRGKKIKWKVRKENGNDLDDACAGLNYSDVNLRFQTNVVTDPKIFANNGGVIDATVNMAADPNVIHKYQVWIGDGPGLPAGPDPVIIVDCSGCGGPPGD